MVSGEACVSKIIGGFFTEMHRLFLVRAYLVEMCYCRRGRGGGSYDAR